MNLEQLHAWLAQHGGFSDSIPTTRSVTKKTPAGDTTADEQVTLMVAADGSQLTLKSTGPDMYEVVGEPKIAAPRATPASAATAKGTKTTIENGEEVTREIEPDGSPGRIVKQGPAPASAAVKPGTTAEPVTGPGGNTSMVTWELMPDGSKGRVIGQEPMTEAQVAALKGTPTAAQQTAKTEADQKENDRKANAWTVTGTQTVKDEANGTSKTVQIQTNQLGQTRPIETVVQELKPGEKYDKPVLGAGGKMVQPVLDANGQVVRYQPMPEGGPEAQTPLKTVDLPNGGKGNLIADSSQPSGYRVEPIAGTGPEKDTAPPPPSAANRPGPQEMDPSMVVDWLAKVGDEIEAERAAGGHDREWALKRAKPYHDHAQTLLKAQEQKSTTAQNVRGQDITQRGQDVSMANQRMGTGGSMFNNMLNTFMGDLGKAKAGSGDPVAALQGLLALSKNYVGGLGGLVNPATVGHGDILGGYGAGMGGAQPASVNAGGGVTINVQGGGAPAAPAAPDPMAMMGMPGGDAAIPGGMNFEGMLRAPGFMEAAYKAAQADPTYQGVDVPGVDPEINDMVKQDVSGGFGGGY